MDDVEVSSYNQSAAINLLAEAKPRILELEPSSLAFSPQESPVTKGIGAKLISKIGQGKLTFNAASELFLRTI